MEETLGKRIVSHRKRLGLTQDQLAEQIGVTAQAVSKWENDQSCPDITILPKLAQIFGTSVDALLGCQPHQEQVFQGEVVTAQEETQEPHGARWDFQYDGSKKSHIATAVWVLLVGSILLVWGLLDREIKFWDVLWPTGLLVFGLSGLYPKISFFRLGCCLFGAYFLLSNLELLPFQAGKAILLPVFLLLFGMSLLADAFRKPSSRIRFLNHREGKMSNDFQQDDDSFSCSTSFGENSYTIRIPRLSRGEAEVSFGELTVNLSGVESLAEGCHIDADCSFGSLLLLVPRRYRVILDSDTAFADITLRGHPDPASQGELTLDSDASFGNIVVEYI